MFGALSSEGCSATIFQHIHADISGMSLLNSTWFDLCPTGCTESCSFCKRRIGRGNWVGWKLEFRLLLLVCFAFGPKRSVRLGQRDFCLHFLRIFPNEQ